MMKEMDEKVSGIDNKLDDTKAELEQGLMNLGLHHKQMKEQVKDRKFLIALPRL